MEMQMLTQDTGEFRGRVSYFVSKFIEAHSQRISQLANGEKFRKSMIFVNEKACSSFEVNFVYYKLGIFKSDQLEVYINGVYVAIVKL